MKKYKSIAKAVLLSCTLALTTRLQRFLGQGSRRPAYHGDDFHGQDKD